MHNLIRTLAAATTFLGIVATAMAAEITPDKLAGIWTGDVTNIGKSGRGVATITLKADGTAISSFVNKRNPECHGERPARFTISGTKVVIKTDDPYEPGNESSCGREMHLEANGDKLEGILLGPLTKKHQEKKGSDWNFQFLLTRK